MEQVHANHGAGDVTLRVTLYLFCAKVSRAQESARAAALARSSLSIFLVRCGWLHEGSLLGSLRCETTQGENLR
jgi:hypothetical protein